MSVTENGVMLAWDPRRPTKDSMCASCGKPGATKRCSSCNYAHYCSRDCQQDHWRSHKLPCKGGGVRAYICRLEVKVQQQAGLLKEAGSAEAVIALLEEMLQQARMMGDAEGERHLNKTLAFRCSAIAQAADAAESSAAHSAAAEMHEQRAREIERVIGALNYKQVVQTMAKGQMKSESSPASALFGAATAGDPLGLMSDAMMAPGGLPQR